MMRLFSFALFPLLLPVSISQSLPSYSGPYGVGLVDIEVPVQNPRNITNTTFTSNGQPAWFLQTVLFSLYYPIASGTNSSAQPHPWIGDPVDCVAVGIVLYANSSLMTDDLVFVALNSVAGSVNIPGSGGYAVSQWYIPVSSATILSWRYLVKDMVLAICWSPRRQWCCHCRN